MKPNPGISSVGSGRPTRVHLVRHGAVHNPANTTYGRLPGFGLSDEGHRMAGRTAAWFTGRDVTVVLSSPLQRARETADRIASVLSLQPVEDERLLEATSVFEGMNNRAARLHSLRYAFDPFTPAWGEPYRAIAARMLATIDEVRRAAAGREAVCVSHQVPIWVARRALEGRRLWHRPSSRRCALGSVTTLTWQHDVLTSIEYADPAAESAVHGV